MARAQFNIAAQPAYVLHSKPYRDTSLLIEVFAPEYGRVGLVARGARSAKSRMRGVLQPFRPLLMSWSGKGDLATLVSAEENGSLFWLTGRALMSGFYLNELLLRLLHRHDPYPTLFKSYDLALRKLALQSDEHLQQALRIFEKELLRDIGYGLVLDHDVITGQPIEAEGMYRYHMEKGPERIAGMHVASTVGIIVHGHTLLGLARNELCGVITLRESKRLLREMLAVHLGRKPLHSRELYSEILTGASA